MAEKEYVLGNKTKDLLVYTFTVTKPIGDKTMDISEVVKMLRTIKELPEAEREAFIVEVVDSLTKANSNRASRKAPSTPTQKRSGKRRFSFCGTSTRPMTATFRPSMTAGST